MDDDRRALADTVLELLRSIAPEIDPSTIDWQRALRRQVDLDSMDWLNFLVALNARLGVDVPETDYGRLVSLADVLDYIEARHRIAAPAREGPHPTP